MHETLRRTRSIAVSLCLLGLLDAHPASARDRRQSARDSYRRATQHYELGEYQKALDDFKEAYRNRPDPALLFNIGQCYRQLGDAAQALREYRVYLLKDPDGPNREDVLELINKLVEEADAKTTSEAENDDAREAPAPVVAPAPIAVAPPPPPLVPPAIPDRSPPKWLSFTAGAVGVAALVSAIALASQAESVSDRERAKDPYARDPRAQADVRTFSSAANALFVTGGVFAIGAGVLALTTKWRKREKHVVLAPSFSRSGVTLSLHGEL
jgi:tetratricopeptide (TPR) repeat protein